MIPAPSAPVRSGVTKGQLHQATKEQYAVNGVGALPAPTFCQLNPPAVGADVWCVDPIKKRRGLLLGDLAQPIYYSSPGVFNDGPDVDSVPLPVFATARRSGVGDNRFNIAGVLTNCPAAPPSVDGQEKMQTRWVELREEAWSLGIDPDTWH